MFDREDDALYLQSRLEGFIDRWHGYRKPWFGIAAEKIAQTQLPQPLAWLYGFLGEWQGRHYWNTLLGNQDCLIPFEELMIRDGKLVFVTENQGVWQVGTDSTGSDPTVWSRIGDGAWQLLDESLTRFLVTFVLHETVFGCRHVVPSENLIAHLADQAMHISPLWLNHPYPACLHDRANQPLTFHIANGTHLIMNNKWCATNADSPWETLPVIFQPKELHAPSVGLEPFDPIPDHLQVPAFMRKSHLQNAIRLHAMEVEYHQGRCTLYRKMLADMNSEKAD